MSNTLEARLKEVIRTIPNFPKPGIMFRDITTLLLHPEVFRESIQDLVRVAKEVKAEAIVGIESRGASLGPP